MTIVCKTFRSPTHSLNDTFGLSVSYTSNPSVEIEHLENVFAKQETATIFCKMINENNVSEVHFHDILEDFLQ